jgi:hypothetical protein
MDILLDVELQGDDRPLETHCRAVIEDGKLSVYFQRTDANIIGYLSPEQHAHCLEKLGVES